MPSVQPPPYVTVAPSPEPRARIEDSIDINLRRLGREARAAGQRDQIGGDRITPSPSARPQNTPQVAIPRAEAAQLAVPVALDRRAPIIEPTVMVHRGINAVNERQKQSDFVRMMRKVTLTEKKYTPEQKADKMIDWLSENGFMSRRLPGGRASQIPMKFYGHDTATSKLFENHGVNIAVNMPWLKSEHIAVIRTLLIDRAHAHKADPNTLNLSVHECLTRYFKSIGNKEASKGVGLVLANDGKSKLTRLSAWHMDDIFFDAENPLNQGGMGHFFAGITAAGYPVGVKKIKNPDAGYEAKTMRRLTEGGYLQAHHTSPPWLVMPCYSGTLADYASVFCNTPSRPVSQHGGGLIGSRYILQKLGAEVVFLHEEMRGIHFDIKTDNLFVSKSLRRIVLGDFGISAQLSDRGYADYRGQTLGHSSPEQLLQQSNITTAADIFSLMTTMASVILGADRNFKEAWAATYPDVTKPRRLFTHVETEIGMAYRCWYDFNSNQPNERTLFSDLTQDQDFALYNTHMLKYKRNDAVMRKCDAPLWAAMRSGLQNKPSQRPTARELVGKVTLTETDLASVEAAWDKVSSHGRAVKSELSRLRGLLKTT